MAEYMTQFSLWFQNLKFRNKLISTYLVISIIPVAILGTFCGLQAHELVIQQEKTNMDGSLQQLVSGVSYKQELYETLSTSIVLNKNLTTAINDSYGEDYSKMYQAYSAIIDPLFATYQATHTELDRITIYTDNMLKHGKTVLPLAEIDAEQWYDQAVSGYDMQWFSNGKDALFATRQLPLAGDDAHPGLLYFQLDYNKIFESFQKLAADGYGIVVTGNKNELIFENGLFPSKSQDAILSKGGQAVFAKDRHSVERDKSMLIRATIPNSNWNVYLSKPTKAITYSIIPIAITVVCVIFGCLLLVWIMSAFFSKTFVKRLELLNLNMNLVKKGQLEVTVTGDATDEMGDIIRNFGEMMDKINKLIFEVYQSKLSQKEYELKVLQAQINPHFLYNSLSMIDWKAIRAGEKDISNMAKLLSTFYRTSLNKGKQLITVEDELKNTTSYIAIQLIMHDQAFDVEYDFDPIIYSYYMISLLLQPIVENAIIHGLDHKAEGKGVLRIIGRIDKDNIRLGVMDNGVGMDKKTLAALLHKDGKGYGVKNVNDRIQLFYGDAYGLHIESSINEGTYVEVILPIRKSDY